VLEDRETQARYADQARREYRHAIKCDESRPGPYAKFARISMQVRSFCIFPLPCRWPALIRPALASQARSANAPPTLKTLNHQP